MKNYTLIFLTAAAMSFVFSLPEAAMASGGDDWGTSVKTADPDLVAAQSAIKGKNWDQAIDLLNKAAARDPGNADIHNLLGYGERNRGNLDAAFKEYDIALKLNPKHRGAHEYVGEAYLMAGNLPKAEEQLAILDKLCLFRCEEYTDLKAAIAKYKTEHPQ